MNMNRVFVLNDLQADEEIEDFICDMDGTTYFDATRITGDNSDICLEKYFDVSPLITVIKDITVLICQETTKGKSVVVGCMKNAEILRKHINYDWLNCRKQIICDAANAFIVDRE